MQESICAPICPLCQRPIPEGVPQSLHHLAPKLKGGKGGPVVLLHHICHKEIHAALTEAELARDFNTPEALRNHPRRAKFAAWMAKRPPDFMSKVSGRRRRQEAFGESIFRTMKARGLPEATPRAGPNREGFS